MNAGICRYNFLFFEKKEMQSKATTPEEYIAEMPADRQKVFSDLRKAIKKNIPKGFKEGMTYGMIGYFVPHSIYPAGYHCDPKQPLPFVNMASQKNGISFYHMGIYSNEKLKNWFLEEYAKLGIGKPDMGKGCIRFKNPEKLPVKLIGELMSKITVEDWVAYVDKFWNNRKATKAKK